MPLITNLQDFANAISTSVRSLRTMITGTSTGTLAALDTTDKSSIVAAINEVQSEVTGGGGGANLTFSRSGTTVTVLSDTGTDAVLPAADGSNAGVMTSAMQIKLAGIEDAADVTDAGNVGSTINGATAKATPVAADLLGLVDTEAANVLKKVTMTNLSNFITALIVDGSPGTLDTLNELAAALGDDPNFAATLTTNLAGKQPLDTDLSAIAALTSAADKVPYATGSGTWALATVTSFIRTLLDDADAATARGTLSVYSQTEIGNPETDLAAYYTTALNA